MRRDIIQNWANKNNIEITQPQFEKLAAFQKRVLNVNEKMNLTAIKDDEGFAVKHIIDSLTLLPYIPENATVLDIGTGAGFPGIVLAIMRPDIRLSLLDSLKKRIQFLKDSLDMLGLNSVECLPHRAEEFARTGAKYDICTARAVARMDKLVKYALPLVRPGGILLAMKGADIVEEIEIAQKALAKHGGNIRNIDLVKISDDISRNIVAVNKL